MSSVDPDVKDALRSVHGTWRVWLLVIIAVLLGGAGIYHLREEAARASLQAADSDARATQRLAELQTAKAARVELDARVEALEKELKDLEPLKKKLEDDAKSKQAVAAQLEALASTLKKELAKDDVHVTVAEDRVKVELHDKSFFDAFEPVISKHGEEVLAKLGPLVAVPEMREVHIASHFDDAAVPDKLKATYPSAWEVTAVHAAAIARALKEKHNVAETVLATAAYGASRPLEPNANAKARARNRRIELELVPKPPPPEPAPAP